MNDVQNAHNLDYHRSSSTKLKWCTPLTSFPTLYSETSTRGWLVHFSLFYAIFSNFFRTVVSLFSFYFDPENDKEPSLRYKDNGKCKQVHMLAPLSSFTLFTFTILYTNANTSILSLFHQESTLPSCVVPEFVRLYFFHWGIEWGLIRDAWPEINCLKCSWTRGPSRIYQLW